MDFSNPLIYIIPGVAIFGYIVKWIIKVERWMGKIDESIRLLEEGAREMRTDIKGLFRNNSGVSSVQVVEKNSPLRLTEAGHSISEALDVKEWAMLTAQDVVPKLRWSHPYDIQVFCMDYVDDPSNFDTEFMDRLKYYAYEESLSMSQIRDVLAIELRDAILKKLPD